MHRSLNTALLLIILAIFILLYHQAFGYHMLIYKITLWLSFFATILFFFDSSNTKWKKNLLRPSVLLLFGLVIIVYQNPIDLLLENYATRGNILHSTPHKDQVFLLGAISYVSYIIGYSFLDKSFNSTKNNYEKSDLKILVGISVVLFLLFLITIDASFFSGEDYIESGSITNTHTNNWEFLLNIINTAIISQYTINNQDKTLSIKQYIGGLPKSFIFIFIIYIILRLISGSRAPVLRAILLMVFSFIYINRKQYIKNYIIIGFIIIGGFIFSVISYSRGIVGTDFKDKYQLGIELFTQSSSISPTTEELARSQSCDVASVEIFDYEYKHHTNGLIQLRYLITLIIPNRILSIIWPTEIKHLGSAYFLTSYRMGDNAESGMGTTLHSDFYVDFGIWGMILCMILMGLLFKKIDATLFSKKNLLFSPFIIVLCISLGASSLYLARAAFIPLLRGPIFAYVIVVINQIISRKI